MKIVVLNTSEHTGGAAIAANRLMKALNKNEIGVKMLVLSKVTNDENVISIQSSFLKKLLSRFKFLWERVVISFHNRFSRKKMFKVSLANTGFDISGHPLVKDADIIHIHWINQGFLSLRVLGKLTEIGKPMVWTMHDMWPVTGICHYAGECDNYTNECGKCVFLKSAKNKDLSHRIFLTKRNAIFSNNNITLVGCSSWISNKAKISGLSKNQTIFSIPNPINTSMFKPINKSLCREKFHLPEDKKLILFGAVNIIDERKGIQYLIKAMEILALKTGAADLELLVFGKSTIDLALVCNLKVNHLNYLSNEEDIVALFNTADVYVTPSLEENLPNTIMESMACGTPCVGFHVGGIPEMIDHKQNGYVAEYKNSKDLAEGIHWVLNKADYNELSTNARTKIESTYREDIVAKQYIELYKKIL